MRVAVVGAGISGLSAAFDLADAGAEVVVYEKEDYLGGHARTVTVDGTDLDLGFMVFNRVTYPNMMEFFERLGVDMEVSDMSFSVSLEGGKGCEWGSRNGLAALFAQKGNLLNPSFWLMLREIFKFKDDTHKYLMELEENPDLDRNGTLELFVKAHGYSELFQKAYLVPICASIWSCPLEGVMNFSAYSILSFFRNHHLLQRLILHHDGVLVPVKSRICFDFFNKTSSLLFNRPQWLTIKHRSHDYVNKLREELEARGCQIKLGCAVQLVSSTDNGCSVLASGLSEEYDECIICTHAPDALKVLGGQITYDELRILGSFQYVYSDIYLHRDKSLMPHNPSAWSAWNFLGTTEKGVYLTYWLNVLQNLGSTSLPFLVTLNPPFTPMHMVLKWTTSHPVPSVAASKASLELDKIQGKRRIWFCGAYQGYGFHEDGLKAGSTVAYKILGKELKLLKNPKHMVLSLTEAGARLVVAKFLERFIRTGTLTLLEDGGTIFVFEGNNKSAHVKSVLKVHNPLFYWKIATEADIGLADAYISGYFSFVDEKEGLLNLLLVLIANRDLRNSFSNNQNKRGWWTPLLLTAGIASARYFLQHLSRKNSISQARRNISQHYDLSNDFFSLFLDETMTYSCAIFKTGTEDLQIGQLRKLSLLIDKAKIESKHEVLEIGFGWGSFAIETVKRTGCKYTGITLSVEQLNFTKRRVEEAGLQDRITLLLCDYRQLQSFQKYDRIISCEMIEGVGHEYLGQFFGCCEKLLAEHGLIILQFISIPDQRYQEYRRSSDFIKEFIFPGGCLPSLNRVSSAITASSNLCIEHVENIGIHYYQTLTCWRNNFMANKRKILALGFDDKFMRTWDYYFIYCAAGFKSRTLGVYQTILSRPGNLKAFSNSYEGFPSAC